MLTPDIFIVMKLTFAHNHTRKCGCTKQAQKTHANANPNANRAADPIVKTIHEKCHTFKVLDGCRVRG